MTLEQTSKKKLNDVNSFMNSFDNIKEMVFYFKGKCHKSKKKYKEYKISITILKSFDTIDIIATTSSSVNLSVTRIRLIALPISAASACEFSLGSKVMYEIVISFAKV